VAECQWVCGDKHEKKKTTHPIPDKKKNTESRHPNPDNFRIVSFKPGQLQNNVIQTRTTSESRHPNPDRKE
jgi:hypothetical protein